MKKVRIRCMVSFEGVRRGDEGDVYLTPRVEALISRGYFRTIEDVSLDGAAEHGPGGDTGGVETGSEAGDLDRGETGSESGEDPDAR